MGIDATGAASRSNICRLSVVGIMDEIRRTGGLQHVEKLSNQEEVPRQLSQEQYPQTIAVASWKLRPSDLGGCPRSRQRIWRSTSSTAVGQEAVQKEVIERVEQTLRVEFASNLRHKPAGRRRGRYEIPCITSTVRRNLVHYLAGGRQSNPAERIKALMFTLDYLIKLDSGSAQTLMRNVDKDKAFQTARRARPRSSCLLPRRDVVACRQDAARYCWPRWDQAAEGCR